MDFSGIAKGIFVSFAGAPFPFIGSNEERQRHMAKQEIKMRTANIFRGWQWNRLTTQLIVKWPIGWTPQDHLGNSAQSSDPNEWYREWLETNVGKQGWSWEWRIHNPPVLSDLDDYLCIRFRKPEHATAFALKWA